MTHDDAILTLLAGPNAAAGRPETSMRIMIVEDDLIIALDAEMTLREAGHEVVGTATTEDGAVTMALREQPEVMLIDLRLAGGGCGRRVAERVRAVLPVAIVFASGNLDGPTRRRLGVLHPAAMLTKPYLPQQLEAAIGKAA